MTPFLKYRLKKSLNFLGIRIRPGKPQRRSMRDFCEHLQVLGFQPGTILDVGVADGTFDLYTVFPESKLLLIEPMAEFEAAMKWIISKYDGEYFIGAAGAERATAEIQFENSISAMHGASLALALDPPEPGIISKREISVERLDTLVSHRNLPGPYLIKVDTQGTELDVVSGASELLEQTEVIILEVSFYKFGSDLPFFNQVIVEMDSIGYVPYDLFGGHNRPFDNALASMDVAFVKRDGQFRKVEVYASHDAQETARNSLLENIRGFFKI